MGGREGWAATTHEWSRDVDPDHLRAIRERADVYAAGGRTHLILEVLAYAADEARELGRPGRVVVRVGADGTIGVTDDGRGTDTRRDRSGRAVRKPVMATKDLRFFDEPGPMLPDGLPRRGMSVVAALSSWLEHTNRRREGSWAQVYAYGLPRDELAELPPAAATGTGVSFRPDPNLVAAGDLDVTLLAAFDTLDVTVLVETEAAGPRVTGA